jgi:opacity protein-like surface antigen
MKRLLLTLLILIFTVSAAPAQMQLGLRGAGVSLAFVSPEDADSAIGFGFFADMGMITNNITVEPYLDYWSKSEDVIGGGAFSVRDMTLGARGKYVFALANSTMRPFAGAGLGLHFARAEITTPDFGLGVSETFEDSDMKVGLDIGGGVMAPFDRFELRGELWYSAVSDFSNLALRVGMMWPFGG